MFSKNENPVCVADMNGYQDLEPGSDEENEMAYDALVDSMQAAYNRRKIKELLEPSQIVVNKGWLIDGIVIGFIAAVFLGVLAERYLG